MRYLQGRKLEHARVLQVRERTQRKCLEQQWMIRETVSGAISIRSEKPA